MSSIREQIIAAAIAALNAGSPPATAERTRTMPIGEDTTNSIVVYPVRSEPEEVGGHAGPVMRARLTFAVECRSKGTSSTRPDQVVDALYVWIVSKLAGNRLGGLVIDIVEGNTAYQYEEGDNPLCLATVEMVADYQYLTANPEARV